MSCNTCLKAEQINACANSLILGTGAADTAYDVYVKNTSTDNVDIFQVTSDGTGLITVDTTDYTFPEGNAFEIWVVLSGESITERQTLTFQQGGGTIEGDCVIFDSISVNLQGCVFTAEENVIDILIEETESDDPCPCIVRQLDYTIGVAGVDADYNFTAPSNTNEQSIQLGNTTIIPANAQIIGITIRTLTSTSGAVALCDVGTTSGGDEILMAIYMSAAGNTESVGSNTSATSNPSSVYFSITPDFSWDAAEMATGKWQIFINYIVQA